MLLGHSKGGVDAAASLSLYWSDLKDKVAGLALVQSPYGGTPVASDMLREDQIGDKETRRIMELLVCKLLRECPMGENLGILKVIVVQGKRLVIRDFKSSDPYVVVKLGNQTAKTKVINSCLNPVWNEELSFTLNDPVGVLNFEVFDKDLLKSDDKMGNAFLNLQPLVSAARIRNILRVSSGETTIRKLVPDSENCLVRESSINSVNGELVQNVWLRLRGVESGEIEFTLRFITPNTPSA